MFARKKAKAPTTVAEALAGFVTLKQQLIDVAAQNVSRCNEGRKRIRDAKAYASEVEATEIAAIGAAEQEILRSENAKDIITKLLGEPVDAVPEAVTDKA